MTPTISDERLLAEVRRLADELGHRPKQNEMREYGKYSVGVYYNHFDSWGNALKQAGFHKGAHQRFKVDPDDLLTEISRLANGDKPPTFELMEQEGEYDGSIYYDHFGSWNKALEKAGYNPNKTPAKRIEKECEICNEVMNLPKYEDDRRFCSRECFSEHRLGNYTGKDHWRYTERVKVECEVCSEEIERPQWQFKRTSIFLCSDDCRSKWVSETNTGNDHPNWVGFETTECDNCGDTVERKPWKLENRDTHYCDMDCLIEDLEVEGETGKRDYGKGWNEEKKEAVREKYDRQCQSCGLVESSHQEFYGTKLPVHHVMPAEWFEDDEQKNAVSNLVPLCCVCHQKWEGIPLKPLLAD